MKNDKTCLKQELTALGVEALGSILTETMELLSNEQRREVNALITKYKGCKASVPSRYCEDYTGNVVSENDVKSEGSFDSIGQYRVHTRMSAELVADKMAQIADQMKQIDDGEVYLDMTEHRDYDSDYWDSDLITEYSDNQGIGNMVMSAIQFAKDCVDDRWYEEALTIYEALWDMDVRAEYEWGEDDWEPDFVDLQTLVDTKIVHTDLKQVELLTLYTIYQTEESENRAKEIYYRVFLFPIQDFQMEEMFRVGSEKLRDTDRFWKNWISLLEGRDGYVCANFLKEAILCSEGLDGLVEYAKRNVQKHPSLFETSFELCVANHDYAKAEKVGGLALSCMDEDLVIRGMIARKAAHVAELLGHEEEAMRLCQECFRSDSTDRNLLRLFATEKLANTYGNQCEKMIETVSRGNLSVRESGELRRNRISEDEYLKLCYYAGDIDKVKSASRNPDGSLGWSDNFIRYGLRLILLFLYEEPTPSLSAGAAVAYVGFQDDAISGRTGKTVTGGDAAWNLNFENEIIEESQEKRISVFWNYFQRWKRYSAPITAERESLYFWARGIVFDRADAIVSGKYSKKYGEVAALLALVAETGESMGLESSKMDIFAKYKKKYPRHTSFQREMKTYFGVDK